MGDFIPNMELKFNSRLITFTKIIFLILFTLTKIGQTSLWAENSNDTAVIKSIEILVIDPDHEKLAADSDLRSQILYLFDIQVGDALIQEKLNKGIQRLELLNEFSSIEVKKTFSPEGTSLEIHLKREYIIKKIKISGNYPLFKNEVRKMISAQIGDRLDQEILQQNANNIAYLYQAKGFYRVQVLPEVIKGTNDHKVTVLFKIEKGFKTYIQEVFFEEKGKQIPEKEKKYFQHILKIYPGNVLEEAKLKKNIRNMEDQLILQGFLKAHISYQIIHTKKYRAQVKVALHKGPQVIVSYKENLSVSDEEISKNIVLFSNRSYAEFDLEECVENIKEIYWRKGFLFVEVSYDKKILNQEKSSITFFIDEGEQVYLKKVTFKGNTNIKSKKLRNQMLVLQRLCPFGHNLFNKIVFEEDLEALKALYTFQGYPWVKIEHKSIFSSKKNLLIKKIIIDEGPQVIVEKIHFQGNEVFPQEQLLKQISLKPGNFFTEKNWRNDRKKLVIFYSNNGYVFAKVSPKANFNREEGSVELTYLINEGEKACFGKYIIRRNVKTNYSVIQDSLSFSEDEPFSYQKIVDSTNELTKLDLFRIARVKPINLEEEEQKIDILVEVDEMNTGRINFGIGYNSVKGYRGYLEVREKNFAGTALGAALRLEYSGIGKQYDLSNEVQSFSKVSLDFQNPLLEPKYKIAGNLNLFNSYEEKYGYDLQQTGLKLRLDKPFHKKINSSLTYRLEAAKLINIDYDKNFELKKDPTISSIKPMVTYDSRDNILDPQRGSFSQLGIELAAKLIGGETRFTKLTWTNATFFPTSSKTVLAIGINTGYAYSPKEEEFPLQEHFFTGGLNSVRGYPEDSLGPEESGLPIGGKVLLVSNVELRQRIFQRLKGVVFFDTGNVWAKRKDVALDSMRYSAGLGFRLITPVGPIRMDYGWILGRKKGESAGKFYISVGHLF